MLEYLSEILPLFLHNLCIDVVDGHELFDLVVYRGCFHRYDGVYHVSWYSVLHEELLDAL